MVRSRQHGLTLLEVLAALLILSVAIFSLMQLQGQAIQNTADARLMARAQAAAETAMDEFLASPQFDASGTTIGSEGDVDIEGYTDNDLTVKLILTEHVPLEEQVTIYVNPSDEEAALEAARDKLPEDSDEEPLPFDPGTYVSVQVEVYNARPPGGLLATLETWVPKPLTEEEKLEAAARAGSDGSTLGSGGSTGGGTGGTGTLPSTGGGSGRSGGGTGTGGRSGNGGAGTGSRPTGGGTTP